MESTVQMNWSLFWICRATRRRCWSEDWMLVNDQATIFTDRIPWHSVAFCKSSAKAKVEVYRKATFWLPSSRSRHPYSEQGFYIRNNPSSIRIPMKPSNLARTQNNHQLKRCVNDKAEATRRILMKNSLIMEDQDSYRRQPSKLSLILERCRIHFQVRKVKQKRPDGKKLVRWLVAI